MKKKISAKILITQLVILCMTLFIFPMNVKADNVSADLFLYNVHHTYEVDNDYVKPFRHKYEFYIHANHEVSGRFIISITTSSDASSHTWWCESGGEIYNNQIMDPSTGTTVYVTGQQDVKVTLMYLTDSAIDIMNVRSILFSQTDLDGNPITTDQSLWSYVQKIEDHEVQLLAQAGFINDQLTDTRQKLTAISNLITTTNTTLSSLLTTATNILTKVTSIDTALQQIDNTIDTISWKTFTSYNLSFSTDGTNFTQDTVTGKKLYVKLDGLNYLADSLLLKINFLIRTESVSYRNNIQLTGVYMNNNVNRNRINEYQYYINNYFYGINVYIGTVINNPIIFMFESEDTMSIRLGQSPITPQYIEKDDIEYWELLGYLNRYDFYEQQKQDNKTIIQKLTELINGNINTNNSVSNNDESNNQFQQQTQQYDQIESTFQSSFTTDQQSVQQEFNNNSLNTIPMTVLWFTQQLTALYNASGRFKMLFTMPLLLGLALYFIGRGAKVSSPNTITEVYDSYDPVNSSRQVVKTTRGTAKGRAFGGYKKRYGGK